MKNLTIPWTITSLRVVALPLLLYFFSQQTYVVTCALFLFVVCTDFLDGYFARKLEASSTLGAYFDATADFLFVSSMFLVFILGELYPLWILLLTVTVFAQFILTNLYLKRTVYDPVGKHYGSLMYSGVGATLFFPEQLVYSGVTIGIVAFTAVSLFSRLAYFLLAQNRK